jgi:hypothetical protein
LTGWVVYRNEAQGILWDAVADGPEWEAMRNRTLKRIAGLWATACLLAIAGRWAHAQQAERFVGTITAINGDVLTVKPDNADARQLEVPSTATLRRVEPGQKDLSSAVTIQLGDLATGDRVLVRLDPNATGETPQAAQIVAIKAADVAVKQQKEREDWARSGVGGLVKSVDPSAGLIVLASGAGPTLKIIKVHVSSSTVLKRYAPASVRFDLAQPGPIDAIHPGDQLRARGTKNADATEIDATEIVSGSFRNISGTIASLDTTESSFTVKDLLTKKTVTVHVTADAQMHALPETMARMLAARLKGGGPGGNGAAAGSAEAGGQQRPVNAQGGGGGGQWSGQGRGQGGDMQQMLNRTPVIHFADLKKGDAVMLVATAGTSDVTAVTLLTGVEPLLEAPEASRNLLANWSMGSGGGAEAEAP